MRARHERPAKKTSANLSINAALIEEAKASGINLSEAAEAGISTALKAERERLWKEQNREAIEDHNRWIKENGLPLARYRMF